MALEGWRVEPCSRAEIRSFVEQWHYSKSINGLMISFCFKLLSANGELKGAIIFGRLGMANAWRKYGEREEDVLELRRLCCVDETPKNAESFFVGACLRWLKKNSITKTVVSYADPNYGHNGTIYKASNFKHVGMSSAGRVIKWNGKKYHDKAIRTKYKGELKPFARQLKSALVAGDAQYQKQEGKHIYLFELRT